MGKKEVLNSIKIVRVGDRISVHITIDGYVYRYNESINSLEMITEGKEVFIATGKYPTIPVDILDENLRELLELAKYLSEEGKIEMKRMPI